ncbi:MAG: hypothetical protein EHM21_03400, partial [Chloroflexi bacterium]
MDTETFIQRLCEFKTLLAKLQQEGYLPPAAQPESTETALTRNQNLGEPGSSIDFSLDAYNAIRTGRDFGRLIATGERMLDESQQYLLLLQEILHNSPVGLAVISGPELVFHLVNATYQQMLPDPRISPVGQAYKMVWSTEMGFDGDQLIRQMLASGKNLNFHRLELRYP